MKASSPERHSLFFRLVYPLIWLTAGLLLTLLGPIRVRGRRNVPRQGGLLILANHLSDIDPVVIHFASPRLIHFMGKQELFEMRGLGAVMRFFRAFPVRRGEPDRAALRHAIDLLQAGECVGIFPEGKLAEDGTLGPLLPGVAMLARKGGVPTICCALRNPQRVMPYGSVIPRPGFRLITAAWSEPRTFGEDATVEEVLGWAESELRRLGAP